MFWPLLILVGLIWTVYYSVYRYDRRKIIELSKKLPGDLTSLPIVGHAYHFRGNDEEQMKVFQKCGRLTTNRGGIASYWIINRLYVVVSDPVATQVILKSCLEKDHVLRFLRFLTGNGSIYAPVSKWRPRRKLLVPKFSSKNLNRFVTIFAERSAITAEQFKALAGQGSFSVWKYLTAYTFDSLCETSLGVQMNSQKNPDQPFLEALGSITELIASRMVQPWLYADFIYKLLPQYRKADKCRRLIYDFLEQVIQNKRQEMKKYVKENSLVNSAELEPSSQSFLEMMLQSSQFTDLELQEEAIVLSVAGTDTSAVATSFAIVMLARHSEVQDKVFEELQEVFGDSDRAVTAEDLPKLKYLEAVIKETMRLYPPVPVIVRSVDNDIQLPSGLTLVKGVGVLVNIWAVHRNPRYWGLDADAFKPERFLEPLKHQSQFMPFSHGLRNCLGYQYAMMSLKTVLATLVRQFRILPPDGVDQSRLKEPLRVKFDVMMKDVDGFQIQLENRCENKV